MSRGRERSPSSGNWMGSAGPLPLDTTAFEVVDAGTGNPVFSRKARLSARADPWSGNEYKKHKCPFPQGREISKTLQGCSMEL
jgi:hypothetical protein